MTDTFGTDRTRAAVLAAWTASTARFREDANAEEDFALGGYRDRLIVELAQNAADAALRRGRARAAPADPARRRPDRRQHRAPRSTRPASRGCPRCASPPSGTRRAPSAGSASGSRRSCRSATSRRSLAATPAPSAGRARTRPPLVAAVPAARRRSSARAAATCRCCACRSTAEPVDVPRGFDTSYGCRCATTRRRRPVRRMLGRDQPRAAARPCPR